MMNNALAVLHIPHASSIIPPEERNNIVLSDEALQQELLQITDWFTDDLFTSGRDDCVALRFPVSRLVLDPERFEDDEKEEMAKKGMGVIYTRSSSGAVLRHNSVADTERERLLDCYYRPHHRCLNQLVADILETHHKALVIDCHSFPKAPLLYENDQRPERADICIGTDNLHTPDWLCDLLLAAFQQRKYTVAVNRPFAGAMIPSNYYTKNVAVSGVMIELRRDLYMDEKTGRRHAGYAALKQALDGVINDLLQSFRVREVADA